MRRTLGAMLTVTALAMAGAAGAHAQSSVPDKLPFVFDGPVGDVAPTPDGGAYVGGNFTAQLPPASGLALARPTGTGDVIAGAAPAVDGSVVAAVSDGHGGVYLGGAFTAVGGVARANVAHLLADGTVDPAWHPATPSPVVDLVVSGTRVYATGMAGSYPMITPWIRAWDAATGAAVPGWTDPFGGALTGQVAGLAASGDRLYVAGQLERSGSPRVAVALDASGALTDWAPRTDAASPPDASTSLSGTDILFAGATVVVTVRRAQLRPDTSLRAYDPTTGATVASAGGGPYELIQGATFAAGKVWYVTTVGYGVQQPGLRSFDPATGSASGPVVSFDDPATGVGSIGDTVYVGGTFRATGDGVVRRGALAWDAARNELAPWAPSVGLPGPAAIAPLGSGVLLAGAFRGAGTPVGTVRDLARVRPDGTLDASFAPYAAKLGDDDRVTALALDGDRLYVGTPSRWTSETGYRTVLASVLTATGKLTELPSPADRAGDVEDLAIRDGDLLVGSSGGIYRVNPRTGAVGENPYVLRSLFVVGDATIYLGGSAISADTFAPTPFAPDPTPAAGPFSDAVTTAAYDAGRLWLGGAFTRLGTVERTALSEVDPVTGKALGPDLATDGKVLQLAASGRRLFATGTFTRLGGATRAGIGAVDPDTGKALPWAPATSGTAVARMRIGGGRLWLVGGAYGYGPGRVSGVTTGPLARFALPPATPDPTAALKALIAGFDPTTTAGLTQTVTVPAAGSVGVLAWVAGHAVAYGVTTVGAAGEARVTLQLTDVGRCILAVYPRFAFPAAAVFVPADGDALIPATGTLQAPAG